MNTKIETVRDLKANANKSDERNNTIFIDEKLLESLNDSDPLGVRIVFEESASYNRLYLEDLKFCNSEIIFWGANSVGVIRQCSEKRYMNLQICGNNFCYIGKNSMLAGFTRAVRILCTPCCSVFIGDECLLADGVRIKTSDGHPIYDFNGNLVNTPGNIIVGDRVWIGLECVLLKNTVVGSGAIIGAKSMLSKRKYPSNRICAGMPCRLIDENHKFLHFADLIDDKTSEEIDIMKSEYAQSHIFTGDSPRSDYVYSLFNSTHNDVSKLSEMLLAVKHVDTDTKEKNRLYIDNYSHNS